MAVIRCYATACKHNSSPYGNIPRGGWCELSNITLAVREDTLDSYTDCQSFEDCGTSKVMLSERQLEEYHKVTKPSEDIIKSENGNLMDGEPCGPDEDSLDVYNEGCGCTCRECQEWHKTLDNK